MTPSRQPNRGLAVRISARPFAWATLAGLVLLSFGCMRDEEEPAPEWFVQSWMSGSRRYPISGPDSTRAGAIKRRGAAVMLQDATSRRLAKASLRRDAEKVAVRDADGLLLGYTRGKVDGVEVVDHEGAVLAALSAKPDQPYEVVDASGEKRAVLSSEEGRIVLRPLPEGEPLVASAGGTPNSVRVARASDDTAWIASLDSRSGLSPLGFALLQVDALPVPIRLGLAVHVDAFGVRRSAELSP